MPVKKGRATAKRSRTNLNDLLQASWDELTFSGILKVHLAQLNWQYDDLSSATQISVSQISGWMRLPFTKSELVNQVDIESNKPTLKTAFDKDLGNRYVSKEEINRIAVALAQQYDKAFSENGKAEKPNQQGMDWLDKTLNDLLNAAGFPAISGNLPNSAIARIRSQKTIRAGWINWADVTVGDPKANLGARARGWSYNILTKISQLLGYELHFVPATFENMSELLNTGYIDLTSPILSLPGRAIETSCSMKIPTASAGIDVIVDKTHKIQILEKSDSPNSIADIEWTKINLNYIAGGVPEIVQAMLMDSPTYSGLSKEFPSFEDGISVVVNQPESSKKENKIECFIADERTCADYCKSFPTLTTLFSDNEEGKNKIKFLELPVVIAAGYQEPKLVELINECLNILDDNDFFKGDNAFPGSE